MGISFIKAPCIPGLYGSSGSIRYVSLPFLHHRLNMSLIDRSVAAYGLEALMANEMRGRIYPCTGPNLIPVGGPYTRAYASCAGVPGRPVEGTDVEGDAYLRALSFSSSHIWRNFGIIWAWWALFVAITAVSLELRRTASTQTKTLLFGWISTSRRIRSQEKQRPPT